MKYKQSIYTYVSLMRHKLSILSVLIPSNEHCPRTQNPTFHLSFTRDPRQFQMPLHNFPSMPPHTPQEQSQFFRILTSLYTQIHLIIPFINLSWAATTLPHTKIWAQLQCLYTEQLDQHVLENWDAFVRKIDFW